MIYHLANFLTLFCGLTLFTLGTYGLMSANLSGMNLLSTILQPFGYSSTLDRAYLALLVIIGIWLTLRIHVRIPAAIALGLILGKMIVLNRGGILGLSLGAALSLILLAVLVRLIVGKNEAEGPFDPNKIDPW